MKKLLILGLVFCCLTTVLSAQQNGSPFYNEIQAFKKQDSLQVPPQNAILFVGSSSFRMWNKLQAAFPEHAIINRGFGGSSLPHVIQYADAIIFPYKPKQIVIYAGENDLTESDTISAQTVFNRFKHLFALIREKQPTVPVVYVSIKPSPSRAHLMPKMVATNRLIKAFLQKQKNATFVNVYPLMLKKDGQPMDDIFLADRLHMNEKGYAIWKKALIPHLKK
jgi:lysophospholipase L1-like esterase